MQKTPQKKSSARGHFYAQKMPMGMRIVLVEVIVGVIVSVSKRQKKPEWNRFTLAL